MNVAPRDIRVHLIPAEFGMRSAGSASRRAADRSCAVNAIFAATEADRRSNRGSAQH